MASKLAARAGATGAPAVQTRVRRGGWWLDGLLLAPLLLLALAPRLVNLGAYSGLFDEGIRTEQLFLMAQGYRPFREIYAAQGPLLLDVLYPLYALFERFVDPSLVAVRLVAVGYSLVGLAGLYWIGRQLAGRSGGAAAALLLALSPLYLEGSRLALAEVPALAPAILAVGCAIRYGRGGRGAWLVAGGLLLTVSLLMKPITVAAAPALAIAAALRGWRGLRLLLLVGLAMLLLVGFVIALLGPAQVWDQIFAYRGASRQEEGWSLRKNVQAIQAGLAFEPAALLPLALLGAPALLIGGWRGGLPALVWALGGLALLLVYSPLHGKHIVILVPGAALLAGAGLVRSGQLLGGLAASGRRLLVLAPLGFALAWYLATLAPLAAQTGQLLKVTADTDVDPAFDQYNDAVAALQALTGPTDFVVTDQPYLAFLAGRKVPPELVDTALARIRSRSLTGAKAVGAASAYQPKVVLLWGDRLRSLPSFKSWVEQEYQVIKIYNRRGDSDRALYLRRDQDFAAARARLAQPLDPSQTATFNGQLRLAGASIDRGELAPGQGATVSLLWELIQPASLDYHVLIELRGPDGRAVDDQQESLSGGSEGTSRWAPGRWMVQSSFVKAERAAPGEYQVVVSLYDSKARAALEPDGQPRGGGLVIGRLAVR